MSASITVTSSINGTDRIFACRVNGGADIPADIFLYENNNGVPGKYVAVCSLSDYNRFQTYDGVTPIPVFANKFIKQAVGTQILHVTDDYSTVAATFQENCQAFRTAYLNSTAPSSTVYNL